MRTGHPLRSLKLAVLTVMMVLSRRSHAQSAAAQPFDLDADTRVLAPLVHQQLAILPIVRRAGATVESGKYVTLAEGLKSGKVLVAERGAGGEVNKVTVTNHAPQPLFLLGGQVILGGQQDRILGKDTVLAPGEVAVVDVFCVEHGRWSGKREFTSAQGVASSKIRLRAKYAGNQSEVWNEVAAKQSALGGQNATGTYRTLATGDAGRKAAEPYRTSILGGLARLPEAGALVGFVAAINGRVTSIEVFDSPALFAAHRDALLDGVFLSAADQPLRVKPAELSPSAMGVKDFIERANKAPAQQAFTSKGASTTHKSAAGVLNSEVKASGAAPAARPVYKSYQAAE